MAVEEVVPVHYVRRWRVCNLGFHRGDGPLCFPGYGISKAGIEGIRYSQDPDGLLLAAVRSVILE